MKRFKNLFFIVIGLLVIGMAGIKASELISSSQVIYKDNKTVNEALDELFEKSNNTSDNLRYNEETGYVQIYNTTLQQWKNIYKTTSYPLVRDYLVLDGYVNNGDNMNMGSTVTSIGGNIVTGKDSRLRINASSGVYNAIGWKVDLTNATKVVFENALASGYKDGSGTSYYAITKDFVFSSSSDVISFSYTPDSNGNVEFDVSELEGEYCILMRATSWGGTPYVSAQNIYVE